MADEADVADGSVVVLGGHASECGAGGGDGVNSSSASASAPRSPQNELISEGLSASAVGSMFMTYKLDQVYVMDASVYMGLQALMVEEPGAFVSVLRTLGNQSELLAREVYAFYRHHDLAVALLKVLMAEAVATTASAGTLFRSNTIVTKLVRNFMKDAGQSYLRTIIVPLIEELRASDMPLEVDPNRLDADDDLEAHWQNLHVVMAKTIAVLLTSGNTIPHSMKRVFSELRALVGSAWPDDEHVQTTAVGGFFFLRFVNPAMLTPAVMGLDEINHPSPSQRRAQTLVTKTLQNLSNMVMFGKKEPYMDRMNSLIEEQMPYMGEFLDSISSELAASNERTFPLPVVPGIDASVGRTLAHIHTFLDRASDALQTLAGALSDSESDASRDAASGVSLDFVNRLAEVVGEISGVRDTTVAAAEEAGLAPTTSESDASSLSQMMNRLAAGAVFYKYKMSKKLFTNSRQKRHVSVDLDEGEIVVKEVGSKKHADRNRIPVTALEAVVAGFHTKVFLKHGKEELEHLCFSLVTESRTLDLECSSESERDAWVEAFAALRATYAAMMTCDGDNEADE
ncbi:uncharacterized protein AMSG_12146 [Thecamonas trahens ATCC 50062]|uniref:Ras GTPase-activating protein n=1 Tax=Thecamonas trahens ATCC 50062 TaxID=461836 RepID=A0A0L0DI90_THETB|nr:hypothetical protein AMSG_12146 [Thecamonas trahens ATCC 50062]KNC51955.1 hypothetical protein AMSG_12146 [Thecamonas trahens ATCC 50062]|eukprot:XP_013755631.1 hypothetical protein AMSG_12146 [Thecamonas trahens ATCC 50062]